VKSRFFQRKKKTERGLYSKTTILYGTGRTTAINFWKDNTSNTNGHAGLKERVERALLISNSRRGVI